MLLNNPFRFSSPFLPSDMTNLVGWWDFDNLATQSINVGLIGSIADQSGNGNHFSQIGSGQKPATVVSGGMNWAEFDGIDDHLLAEDDDLLDPDAGSMAWFIIFKSDALSDGTLLAKGNNPLDPRWNFRVGFSTNQFLTLINDDIGGGDDFILDDTEDWTDDTVRLVTVILERDTDDEWKIYSDGVETADSGVAVTTASVASTQRVYMGVQSSLINLSYGSKIGEIVMVKNVPPGTEKVDMEEALMAKWGIT